MHRAAPRPPDDTLLEVIARTRDDLRPSDSRVADVILADPAAALDMTLAALSRAAGVSEPTVLRFCSAIGCEGMRDLRVCLARALAFARTTSNLAISAEDGLSDIVEKMFDFNLSNLTWARSRLDVTAVDAAVKAILAARRLEFFGFGASAIVAQDAAQKFPLFGVPCSAPRDGHQLYITAAMLGQVTWLLASPTREPPVTWCRALRLPAVPVPRRWASAAMPRARCWRNVTFRWSWKRSRIRTSIHPRSLACRLWSLWTSSLLPSALRAALTMARGSRR